MPLCVRWFCKVSFWPVTVVAKVIDWGVGGEGTVVSETLIFFSSMWQRVRLEDTLKEYIKLCWIGLNFLVSSTAWSILIQQLTKMTLTVISQYHQNYAPVRLTEFRWLSWAPIPNKPTVSVDIKQHFNNIRLTAWLQNIHCRLARYTTSGIRCGLWRLQW